MTTQPTLFPFFGNKRRVAAEVWKYLGDPDNYCEPFFGSGAVLLARESQPRSEVVNDLDGLLVNFWRAIRSDWRAVAADLGGPVAEIDITAFHARLLNAREVLTTKLMDDPDYYDTELAALWWTGISSWLGSGWGWRPAKQRPHIDRSLKGIYAAGCTDERIASVAARLSGVVVLCGDWKRTCTPAIINRFKGSCGVFLDPPYAGDRQKGLYAKDAHVRDEIQDWCHTVPNHAKVVIAGYEGEYDLPGWRQVYWHAPNGYAGQANQRRAQEVLYIKPRFVKRRSG